MRLFLFLTLSFTCEIIYCQDPATFKCITISKDDFYSDMKLKPEIMIIDVSTKAEFLDRKSVV